MARLNRPVVIIIAGLLTIVGAGVASGAQIDRSSVVICRDAGAGGYEAFPDVCRTKDGELLCVFYAGFHHVSLPSYGPGGKLPPEAPKAGRICMTRSRDDGKTWSKPTIVVDSELDDRDPSIAQLKDGTLLVNYFAHRPGRWGRGFQLVHSALVRSTDGGKTWSEPQELFRKWACSSPIRPLSDGRLALPLYYAPGGGSGVNGIGGVSFSSDNARTWSDPPVPIGKNTKMKLAAEPDIVELPGKKLLAGLRPDTGERSMAFSWSGNMGASWSDPKPTGYPAHNIYFLLTRRNILLMGHRLPGTSLHYSLDFGKTWSQNVELDPLGGGYPSMVELGEDGLIFCAHYKEGARADVLGMRFRATRDEGIKIIPPSEW